MRASLLFAPALLAAAPVAAAPPSPTQLPTELSDPALADKLHRMMGVLTKVMMDVPVGELEAAFEGRTPTEADKRKRVRDEIGGPDAERQLTEQIAASGPQVRAMQKALVSSLPKIMGALEGVGKELERAIANMPDPTYPRR